MHRARRFLGIAFAVLAGLLLLAIAAIFFRSQRALADTGADLEFRRAPVTADAMVTARRQLRTLGCISCHGDGLRGKIFLDEARVAKIYAPNISLLAKSMSDDALDRAIRGGVGHDGRALLVMPSEGYQHLTDAEAAALIAAIRALPPGGSPTPDRHIGPLARLGLATNGFQSAPALRAAYAANPLPRLGATGKGRHLVELGCISCHGPDLKGKEIEPGVVSADLSVAAGYDEAQFRTLLREGVAPSGKDLGLMAGIAKEDTRHLDDGEIAAIHAYLVAHAERSN